MTLSIGIERLNKLDLLSFFGNYIPECPIRGKYSITNLQKLISFEFCKKVWKVSCLIPKI